MHANHKKKSRVRNRPRNKCNRTGEKGSDDNSDDNDRNGFKPVSELPEPAKAEPDTSAIYFIQKLLRQKLLAKKPATGSANAELQTPATPAAQTPATPVAQAVQAVATPAIVKSSVPIFKFDALGSQSSEVNDLLKCLGSKLQKGSTELGKGALLSQLGEMLSKTPLSDVESSDEEAEYVEYIYKPRQYFVASLCNYCKSDLCGMQRTPCKACGMVYYCNSAHMRRDQPHRLLCLGLRQLIHRQGHEIFYNCGGLSAEQFRSYRIQCLRQLEQIMNRNLTAAEQEVLLFPLICSEGKCRECNFKLLLPCSNCGEVAGCKDKSDHLSDSHAKWCSSYWLFKAFVVHLAAFSRVEPPLPDKVLHEMPIGCTNTRQVLEKLSFDVPDKCEFAALTQISTGPLTAFHSLMLCGRLPAKELTIHLIGAEMEFEVDVFQKWEIFFLHIVPSLQTLKIVFVGPELNPKNIPFEHFSRIKCCHMCRKSGRSVQYHFENRLYHDYCIVPGFLKPDLVCFFNAGVYRATGYGLEDTWPPTIQATLNLKCPISVTSYTEYEAPQDLDQFLKQSKRHLTVVLPPTKNPYGSEKPDRNFISDDVAPFIFKNHQYFILQ